MSKKYKSDAMAAIHEMIEDLHVGGVIDKQTMRRFDDACLTPIRPLKPEEIKAIREREDVSQTVFANYLNVTSSLVSKWERGEKRASGASLKLLSLVEIAIVIDEGVDLFLPDAHHLRGFFLEGHAGQKILDASGRRQRGIAISGDLLRGDFRLGCGRWLLHMPAGPRTGSSLWNQTIPGLRGGKQGGGRTQKTGVRSQNEGGACGASNNRAKTLR